MTSHTEDDISDFTSHLFKQEACKAIETMSKLANLHSYNKVNSDLINEPFTKDGLVLQKGWIKVVDLDLIYLTLDVKYFDGDCRRHRNVVWSTAKPVKRDRFEEWCRST